MTLLKKKKSKGFTLVEILLVVGFIALAGIGIYTIYSKVQISNQANQESRNLDTLRAGVKSLYASRPNFTGVTNTVANQARVTPDNMRTEAIAEIINSFGGAVTIEPVGLGGGTNNGFVIQYDDVPSAVCTKLATSAGVQFNSVSIGASTPAGSVKEFASNAPIDVALATQECNASDTVSMYFFSL